VDAVLLSVVDSDSFSVQPLRTKIPNNAISKIVFFIARFKFEELKKNITKIPNDKKLSN